MRSDLESHPWQWLALGSVAVPLAAGNRAAAWAAGGWERALRLWSRRRALRFLVLLAAIPALAFLSLVHYVYFDERGLPDLQGLLQFEPPTTGRVYDANGGVLLEMATEYRHLVSYREIPLVVRQAILAAEDKNYFSHEGVDFSAWPRVAWKALRETVREARSPVASGSDGLLRMPQGGSTITQQLVRSYFLRDLTAREGGSELVSESWRTRAAAAALGAPTTNKLLRKLEEIRISLWLERELERVYGSRRAAKEEILARYASFIYLGHARYGFAAASDYYFDRPLESLGPEDADKAACLAGIAKSPRAYAPTPSGLERARRRRNQVLGLMAARGYLPRALARRLEATPLRIVPPRPLSTDAPAAVEQALRELRRDGRWGVESLAAGRIFLHSTLDRRIQSAANDALEEGLRRYEARHPDSGAFIQGAAVVLRNRDAAVLALVGGRKRYRGLDNSWADLNRAVETRRQPGSTIKPLLYLAAFRNGSALNGLEPDEPIAVPMGHLRVKWVSNYDGVFQGPIALREALAQSRNAPAMWLAREIGVESVLRTARDLGLESPLRPDLSTVLGASEVSLLDLANMFRAIASGLRAEPYVLARITDHRGGIRYEPARRALPLPVDPEALLQVQEGLRGTVRLPRGTAHALAATGFPVPVLGKTGTTNGFRDALFVGSTYGEDGLTAGVWIGFDDNRSLGPGETGAKNALPVFAEVMRQVYERQRIAVAPPIPEAIERGIDSYLDSRQAVRSGPPPETALVAAPVALSLPAARGGAGEEK
jgi:membrane peptidoglycan carboxypeptidase